MRSETSMVAEQCRLKEWAVQIKDCQNRPAGMKVAEWCTGQGITKASYYYRLRRVRETCLETIREETAGQQIVPIQPALLHPAQEGCSVQAGLDISIKGCSIHVTEQTSLQLLAAVLEVMQGAE